MSDFAVTVLYTYETVDGQAVCHAYGYASEAEAVVAREKLVRPGRSFMVLPLEANPEPR